MRWLKVPVSPLLKEITHDFVMPSKQRNHTWQNHVWFCQADKIMPSKQAFTRNLIKERCESARSFRLWHVCVTEIYPYAMTSMCTLLLVIHVRYDSSTCDIKFMRTNYCPCIKQSTQSFKILKGRFCHETAYFHSLEYTTRRGWPDKQRYSYAHHAVMQSPFIENNSIRVTIPEMTE